MKRLGVFLVAIASFALGTIAQRLYDTRGARQTAEVPSSAGTAAKRATSAIPLTLADTFDRSGIDFSKEPYWAWGHADAPEPGDKAKPQANPTGRRLRANEDQDEQLRMRHLPGSTAAFSLVDIRDAVNVVDWFPEDHPNPMPDIIRHGPAAAGPMNRACGSCHLADGAGRPENASPAGLPAGYIVRQLEDFRNDLRHTSDPRKANSNTMIMLAKAMSEDEIREAAEYFAAVAWRPHVRVIETSLVPTTRVQGDLFIATSKERTEPIAGRIIEVPADEEVNEVLRSPHGQWIAYVPPGAVKRGRDLVTTGGMRVEHGQIVQGRTTACGTCHGIDLMGVPPDVPPIAGRSPSYLARQIFDIQQGARNGSNSNVKLMKMIVDRLTPADIVDITAYLASLPVPSASARPVVTQH